MITRTLKKSLASVLIAAGLSLAVAPSASALAILYFEDPETDLQSVVPGALLALGLGAGTY